MDKVEVAGRASAQNGRGRTTSSSTGARPQVLGRQNTREERDNDMVTRFYSTRGRNRQFGFGASPTPTQSNRPTTRSQSTQGSLLQERTRPEIGEEPNSPANAKQIQHEKEVSSQLSIHEICSGACIAQNISINQEPMQAPSCSTAPPAPAIADNNNSDTVEDFWGSSPPETLHQNESKAIVRAGSGERGF
jgi:hypothetical protein